MTHHVIGLDLSIAATGIALPDGTTTTITSRNRDDHRLITIAEAVHGAVLYPTAQYQLVDLVVIEDLPTHANGAGITGMVHGAVRVVLLRRGVPYVLVTPASLKKYATGKGNATKADMRMALFQRTGLDLRDDNQVDAFWLRAMGLDHLDEPLLKLPAAHRTALDKVAWPEVTP